MSKEKCVLVKESEYKELKRTAEEASLVVDIQFSSWDNWFGSPRTYSSTKANINLSDGLLQQIRRIVGIVTDGMNMKHKSHINSLIESHNKDLDNSLKDVIYDNKRMLKRMSVWEFISERRRLRRES